MKPTGNLVLNTHVRRPCLYSQITNWIPTLTNDTLRLLPWKPISLRLLPWKPHTQWKGRSQQEKLPWTCTGVLPCKNSNMVELSLSIQGTIRPANEENFEILSSPKLITCSTSTTEASMTDDVMLFDVFSDLDNCILVCYLSLVRDFVRCCAKIFTLSTARGQLCNDDVRVIMDNVTMIWKR